MVRVVKDGVVAVQDLSSEHPNVIEPNDDADVADVLELHDVVFCLEVDPVVIESESDVLVQVSLVAVDGEGID